MHTNEGSEEMRNPGAASTNHNPIPNPNPIPPKPPRSSVASSNVGKINININSSSSNSNNNNINNNNTASVASSRSGYRPLSHNESVISLPIPSRSTNPFDDDHDDDTMKGRYDNNNDVEVSLSLNRLNNVDSASTSVPVVTSIASNSQGRPKIVNKNRMRLRSLLQSTGQDDALSSSASEAVEGQELVSIDKYEDNLIIRFLIKERVFGFPGSHGTFFSNFCQFTFNNHPFISFFLAHYLHPLTRLRRLSLFFCTLFFAVAVSYVLATTNDITDLAICRDGCSGKNSFEEGSLRDDSHNTSVVYSRMCVYSFDDRQVRIPYDEFDEKCHYYRPWQLSAIGGLIITAFGIFLKFIATCSCLQGRELCMPSSYKGSSRSGKSGHSSCCGCVGRFCKALIDGCGGLILFACTTVCLCLLAWTLLEIYMNDPKNANYHIIVDTCVSKLWSFFQWFLYTLPYFSFVYQRDKDDFYSKIEKRRPFLRISDGGNNNSNTNNNRSSNNPMRDHEIEMT